MHACLQRRAWQSFLCVFAQEHADFRLQELVSAARATNSELKYDPKDYSNKNPYLMIQLQSEDDASRILKRSVLMKLMVELWAHGRSYDELKTSLESLPLEQLRPFTRSDYTFKFVASAFPKKLSAPKQRELFDRVLSFLPFKGKVDLTNPKHTFYVLEDYGDDPNLAPPHPHRVFFGRMVSRGQRHLGTLYSVKTRHFIGNTSMDAELSLLMANQGKVRPGDVVMDPYAGTGGVLVAAAHFGAHVMGTDINRELLHGRTKSTRGMSVCRGRDENMRANMRQYGLEHLYLDMLVADSTKCVWRGQELFDAILTDPPYGVRERIAGGSRSPSPDQKSEESKYKLSGMFTNLLEFSARFLVLGGRLVYWLPVVKNEFKRSFLPSHPSLELVACSEQPLQRFVARLLITMEKQRPWIQDSTRAKEELAIHDQFREKYFTSDKSL